MNTNISRNSWDRSVW